MATTLQRLRTQSDWAANVTAWRVLPERQAMLAPFPPELHPALVRMLQAQGITGLYVHQAQAVEHVLRGHHVVIVTPTASGKTLCYNLPVLHHLLSQAHGNALYLFPTKALAHDQLAILNHALEALELAVRAEAYDGDTSSSQRGSIRRSLAQGPGIIATNPDMLHVGMLPYHTQWRSFFSELAFVILDEVHTYRGVFGSHVANVLRRLRRIARFYGSDPLFICTSATIANPEELVRRLIDAPATLVAQNGAPQSERTMIFYNPPLRDEALGLRTPALTEARRLANELLDQDIQTVIFVPSRRMVEQMVIHLRQDAVRGDAPHHGREPAAIRGYRGGYLAQERREIEEGLRRGSVRAVVATNALELGVDIGGLAACIMVGYPGTIASTWQRAGRAGRAHEKGLAVLMASSSPSDQYVITHPDYFFGRPPEHALLNPDNLYLLIDHARCAAWELPFGADEVFGGEDIQEVLAFLQEGGEVRRSGFRWYWTSEQFPASQVSLRAATADTLAIVAEGREGSSPGERQVIGQIDRASAPVWVHEGAIYMHEGQQYLVERLDWEAGVAQVRAVTVDYYTEASQSTRVAIQKVHDELSLGDVRLARGEIKLTRRASGYRKLSLGASGGRGAGEHLGWGAIDLPEQEMLTSACWIAISEDVIERLREEGWWVGEYVASRGPDWAAQRELARRRDGYRCRWCNASERPGRQHEVHHVIPFREFGWIPGENEAYRQANRLENLVTLCPSCHRKAEQQVAVQSTLASLSRVIGHVIPLLFMCDRHDLGIQSDVKAPQTGLPTLFIFDAIPGGVGLSDEVPGAYAAILARSAELIRDCPCTSGCPSCIGAAAAIEPKAKEQTLRLIAAIQPQ
ncbi:MAG: DEAD/DEAH box helicase [Anaerolineae bacterium]|nr:DEAD/DEAH box helicase [Anaerolineae bacterium]